MKEALEGIDGISIDAVSEDHYFPKPRSVLARVMGRLFKVVRRWRLERAVATRLVSSKPHVMMVYKGSNVCARLVRRAKRLGISTVNIFPDHSPHVYGKFLQSAIGAYDVVISTKPFHRDGCVTIYGYSNRCVLVPHGYDPAVHLWHRYESDHNYDVVMAATWRPEYDRLLLEFAHEMGHHDLRVGLAGSGWDKRMHAFPAHWEYAGIPTGRAYGEWLRRGKIAIAPVNTEVIANGVRQPGDQDTTRTYELAAANCFFLHRRTPFAQMVYDESTEVPMWESARELAEHVKHYLPLAQERKTMAAAAHARAVPAYSIPRRAEQILGHVRSTLIEQRAGR
jgi:spore maturation protein CgeB